MQRIDYAEVLRKVEGLWLGTRNDMPALDAATAQTHINTWAGQLWEQYFWPEWTVTERRQFRQSWASGTTYGAPPAAAAVERYHVRTGKYFQSLRGLNTGNVPEDDDGVENSAWWAACQSEYSGDEYAAGVFNVADIVRNPDDDRHYQCHTAHTGTSTFDATKFGILTVFKRSIAYEQSWETHAIGKPQAIYDCDPEIHFDSANKMGFNEGTAILVAGYQTRVWVKFRLRAPQWIGEAYAAGTTYSEDDQVRDGTQGGDGDFYRSLTDVNTTALTDVGAWERLEFPWVLRDAVARAAYSEFLAADGLDEKAAVQMGVAMQLALKEFTKVSRTTSQRQLPVTI